ncbi:hypothetical protein AHF37_11323 [Paragonimus kellicotti]|nr:hypothetical protein AHF37_11323 [Paragonimus kellicotti]
MRLEFPPGIIFYAAGKVVHGFGRGSKQLGIPTANLDESVVSRLPDSLQNGIYFGWAKVDQHPVTKTVVSVGWNPFFKNSKRSVEAHLMGKTDGDFYGSVIQLLILKYHRPEKDFVIYMRLEFPPGIIFYAAGKVVHGFGRGSKQLGIPTANLDESVVSRLPDSLQNGIYFGWAKVDQHPVTKTVVSVGWNPFFKNSKRSVEAHLMGKTDGDFYGSVIQLLILKYHRPEKDFVNLIGVAVWYLKLNTLHVFLKTVMLY